jgi:hypothetical protein
VHPFIADVVRRLERSRAGLRQAIDAVPAHVRGRRPTDDRWSANEVLEHLSIVETNFTAKVVEAIAAAREAGLGREQAAERPALPQNIEAVLADRLNRRTAPERAHPRGGLDNDAAWQAVEHARRGLVETLTGAEGLALSDVYTSHPAFGTMTVYQMSELIAAHEARHTAQIREIADAFVNT